MNDDAGPIANLRQLGFCMVRGGAPRRVVEREHRALTERLAAPDAECCTWTRTGMVWEQPPSPALVVRPVQSLLDQQFGAGGWRISRRYGYRHMRLPPATPVPWCEQTADWHVDPPHVWSTEHVHRHSHGGAVLVLQTFLSGVGPGECSILVRPGSHRIAESVLAQQPGRAMGNAELSAAVAAASRDVPAVEIYGAAGDVMLMHGLLLHVGGPHRGARSRALATSFAEAVWLEQTTDG